MNCGERAEIYNMLKVGCCHGDGDDAAAPWRPDLSIIKCDAFVRQCIEECMQLDPDLRPDFKYTRVQLKSMQKGLWVDNNEFVNDNL